SNINPDPANPFFTAFTEALNVYSYQSYASKFTVTGSDYDLTAIELGLSLAYHDGDSSVFVSLVEDENGVPGQQPLDQIYLPTGIITNPPRLVTANSGNRPRLMRGRTYWVTLV